MESLTALGAAANVVQFVGFAFELFSKSREIYNSAEGSTSKALTLETIYTRLRDLSSCLEVSSQKDQRLAAVEGTPEIVKHTFAVNDLSASCKRDCDRILEVVRKLQRGGRTKNRWHSFKLALRTIWKSSEVADLEERLHHVQGTLTLHICTLTSYWHGVFQRQLEGMQRENWYLNMQQSTRLEEVAKTIHAVSERIVVAGTESMAKPLQSTDIQSLQSQMSQLSVAKMDVTKEHKIWRSLRFESLPMRYASILEAHQRTFGWVFSEPDHAHKEDSMGSLLGWLRKGEGIFWVSGKPGSGKSTLMKFVTDHAQTIPALSVWSYPKPAIILSHFFWSAGSPMQKSWQGLLQTLLSQIFQQLPDLIESTCAERWTLTAEQLDHTAWHLPEMRRILQRIARREGLPARLCFFIDGLDEFEGDHLEFCRVLQDLSESSNMKLCVSSRPWNVFEDSFDRDNSSKLYMHMLTQQDIQFYTESRLQEHPRWTELNVEPEKRIWLIDEITERAAGVFLWVFLVTGQLRNGLTEYDSFSDLRRRLESIPTDLENFFKHILGSVETVYHEKMATTLQMALAARQPAPTAIYNFHDEEYEAEDYALNLPIESAGGEKDTSMQTLMARRLSARTRGLLEVNKNRVGFLHRTVMDYLRTAEMSRYLDEKAPAWFSAHLSLLRAYTAYLKSNQFSDLIDRTGFAQYVISNFTSGLWEAVSHAKVLRENFIVFRLLDELANCIPQMQQKRMINLHVWGNSLNPISLFFWEPVIDTFLIEYLHYVLPELPSYFTGFQASAESFLVFSMVVSLTNTLDPREQMDMFQKLLTNAYHPTETYCDSSEIEIPRNLVESAWEEVLRKVIPSDLTLKKPGSLFPQSRDTGIWTLEWTLKSELMTLMLKHGADPNAAIHERKPSEGTPVWVSFVLLSFCIPLGSSYDTMYLQLLSLFMNAGADMRIKIPRPGVSDFESRNSTGLDLFLDHLSHAPAGKVVCPNQPLLSEVAGRLLIAARIFGIDIDDYWPILENAFQPQTISRLRRSLGELGKHLNECHT